MGSPEQAETLLTEALETADALNDLDAQARALSALYHLRFRGEYGRARIAAERIEQIAHRIGDPASVRFADRHNGHHAAHRAADLARLSNILNAFFDLPSCRGIALA